MHKIMQDALRWIVGTHSKTFQVLTQNLRKCSHPRTEENLLLRYFHEYVLEACKAQAAGVHLAHLNLPHILSERQGWCREIKKVANEKMLNKFVCLCILLRDFADIRTYVESKLKWEPVAKQRKALDVLTVGAGGDGAGAATGSSVVTVGSVVDGERVQAKATTMVHYLPHFMTVKGDDWWKWDKRLETYKSAIWNRTVQQINAEASLVFCGEIIKYKHDMQKAATVFCQVSTDFEDDVQYTPERVMAWYRGEPQTRDMRMICDMYNFKSSTKTSDYTHVAGLAYGKRPKVRVQIIRVVASYCSVMVQRVNHAVLRELLRINLDELKLTGLLYERIHDKTPELQEEYIHKTKHLIPNCMRLHQACAEMEKMLRTYLFLHHSQGPDHTRTLVAHLMQTGIFSENDDVWTVFQNWVTQKALGIRSSQISAAILNWAGASFVRFARSAQVDAIIVPDDADADADYLLDPMCFADIFEDTQLIESQ